MYIQSNLIEAGKTVCDLQLTDGYREDELIYLANKVDKEGDYVEVDSRMLYTSGLCIMETYLSIHKKVTDQFYIDGEHVKYTFFLNGRSRVSELPLEQRFDLDIGVMRRNYLPDSKWDVEMKGGNEVNYVAIIMSKKFFLKLIDREAWAREDSFVQDVAMHSAKTDVDETYPVNLPILKVLRELLYQEYWGSNRRYYVELKLKELLFAAHEQQRAMSTVISVVEPQVQEVLEKIKAYLVIHFDRPPTIKQLSRMFLMNEMKLKQRFKACYGTTIYAYVIQLRMEKAQKMLLEDYSVNEMAAELGYASVSHFISTFKNYFGHTPKQALKKISNMIPLTFLAPYLDYFSFMG